MINFKVVSIVRRIWDHRNVSGKKGFGFGSFWNSYPAQADMKLAQSRGSKYRSLTVTARAKTKPKKLLESYFPILGGPDSIFRLISLDSRGWVAMSR